VWHGGEFYAQSLLDWSAIGDELSGTHMPSRNHAAVFKKAAWSSPEELDAYVRANRDIVDSGLRQLFPLLADGDPPTRAFADRVLSQVGGKTVLARIDNIEIQTACVDGLVAIGTDTVVSDLVRLLESEILVLRNKASEGLSALGRSGKVDLARMLVLIAGPSASSKSITLAAIVNASIHRHRKHILTIEDPIEFVYNPVASVVSRRQVGRDVDTFATASKASFCESPDVVLVGELRDNETISLAISRWRPPAPWCSAPCTPARRPAAWTESSIPTPRRRRPSMSTCGRV
jgi:hypothetical protein